MNTTATKMNANGFKVRAGQREFERGVERHRVAALLARRQFGKTTIASRVSLHRMLDIPGHTVIFGSVKLDLGREIVRKEASEMQASIRMLTSGMEPGAFQIGISGKDKVPDKLTADDFADLYEATRLEFRLWHSKSVCSRTKVVALTTAAVGETGDLIGDEVGRVRNFRDVWEAIKPIIASNPKFRCMLTTTPPPDDTHFSHELLAPPIGASFPVSPIGNWYRSEEGVHVLRVTAWDAYADGIPMYDDDTGAPIDPDTSRARDPNKDAWDRNYAVKFLLSGTAACGLLQLNAAQTRGIGKCALFIIEDDIGFQQALAWLAKNIGPGPVGFGVDPATTTNETSNPTVVAVVERADKEFFYRACFVWKTTDPELARERVRLIVQTIAARPEGGRAKRLCVDSTNERYWCKDLKTELAGLVPVELVVASETIERPGSEPMTMKQYLGGLYTGLYDDNAITAPPERYFKEDHRLVLKDRGSFVCDPDAEGRHGDTFDGGKLGLWALVGKAGTVPTVHLPVGMCRNGMGAMGGWRGGL